jgi:hypothetical protein
MSPRTPRRSHVQTVAVTIVASGMQAVSVYTQSPGGAGSYISVVTPNVMVTLHDQQALRTYANAWTDMRTAALHLPKHRVLTVEHSARRMPGLVIAAHGKDKTAGIHRVARNDIAIRIGYVTWILADNLAFRSMTEAWEHAQTAGERFLPVSVTDNADTNRRRIFPTTPLHNAPAAMARRLGAARPAATNPTGGGAPDEPST